MHTSHRESRFERERASERGSIPSHFHPDANLNRSESRKKGEEGKRCRSLNDRKKLRKTRRKSLKVKVSKVWCHVVMKGKCACRIARKGHFWGKGGVGGPAPGGGMERWREKSAQSTIHTCHALLKIMGQMYNILVARGVGGEKQRGLRLSPVAGG